MRLNERIDFDLYEAIGDLVDAGTLENGTAAYDIAQRVIHEGYDSLSTDQRDVYDAVVTPALLSRAEKLETLWYAGIETLPARDSSQKT